MYVRKWGVVQWSALRLSDWQLGGLLLTAVDKTNDQRTLIPIMGIGQALVHYCSCIAAYVGDLPLYILLHDIIFALDIRAWQPIHAGEID